MRRRRGPFAVLATVVLSLLAAGFAGSAAAGGPTSVLLVVPGEGRIAALYNDNPDYQRLADLVGAFGSDTGSTIPPKGADDTGASGTDDTSGPGVTLTWLMHDVNVWRIDRVYLKAQGGVLISTQTTLDGGDLWSKPASWRRVGSAGAGLTALLDRLGVGNTGAGFDQKAQRAQAEQTAAGPTAPALTATGSSAAGSGEPERSSGGAGPDGWIWATAGVLLGIALTLTLNRRRNAGGSAGRAGDEAAADRLGPADGDEPTTVEIPSAVPAPTPPTETLSSPGPR